MSNERKIRFDPDLADMAKAWGLIRPRRPKSSVVKSDSGPSDSRGSNQESPESVNPQGSYRDGTKLMGIDLGAKGVLQAAPIYSKSFAKSKSSRS